MKATPLAVIERAKSAFSLQNALGVEVTLRRRLPAERICLVGKPHMHRVAIEFAVHGNRGDSEFASGTNDAHGDLATVGNQDFLQHRLQYCRSGDPDCYLTR